MGADEVDAATCGAAEGEDDGSDSADSGAAIDGAIGDIWSGVTADDEPTGTAARCAARAVWHADLPRPKRAPSAQRAPSRPGEPEWLRRRRESYTGLHDLSRRLRTEAHEEAVERDRELTSRKLASAASGSRTERQHRLHDECGEMQLRLLDMWEEEDAARVEQARKAVADVTAGALETRRAGLLRHGAMPTSNNCP